MGEQTTILYAVVILLGLIIGGIVARRIFRGRRPGRLPPIDLSIDVAALATGGPPSAGPILEYQGIPVRVAAVVLAPAGRARPVPPREVWPQLLDSVFPGLSRVVESHRPVVRVWPPQLSESGFVHRFFAEVKFPQPAGQAMPWSAVAGPVRFQDQLVLVGFVFRTDEPTTFGTEAVDSPTAWRKILSLHRA
jgi:hypothetical protein